MTRKAQLTRWRRSAAFRSNPLAYLAPLSAIGLAMAAFSMIRYGFSRPLIVGLCAGLVNSGVSKLIYRRYLDYYVDNSLGLGRSDFGIDILHTLVNVPCFLAIVFSGPGYRPFWAGIGAFFAVSILLWPEQKAIHEGIKAKLAEMESAPDQQETPG